MKNINTYQKERSFCWLRPTLIITLSFSFFSANISATVNSNKVEGNETSSSKVISINQQKTITISGIIRDNSGEEIIGASVVVKGTTIGVMTDIDGKYTLNDIPENSIITVSYIGYDNQNITIKGGGTYNITLKEDSQLMDEVVVVGYGVQKKANLTGSVSAITGDKLASRPLINVSSGLGGLAPGLSVRQETGEPGKDGAKIRIRGVGTLNKDSQGPLVIIDGMEGDMNYINPQDIEDISVLKDAASSSIYGSRAANGVILITTKKGKVGRNTITLDASLSIAKPSRIPKFVTNYVDYMGYVNEAAQNIKQTAPFGQADLDAWTKANADPNGMAESGYPNYVAYPNTDWFDALFETNVIQTYDIGANGGTDKIRYNMSLRYQNNPGIVMKSGSEMYQGRINLESKLTKFLTIGTQTWFSNQKLGPADMDRVDPFKWVLATTPGVYPKYDGKYGHKSAAGESGQANNVINRLEDVKGKNINERISTTWYAKFDIIKGLSFETKVNYYRKYNETTRYQYSSDRYDFASGINVSPAGSPTNAATTNSFKKEYRITTDNVLRYTTTINKHHDISALVGHNEYYYNERQFSASGIGMIDFDLAQLDATNTPHKVTGKETDYSMRSFFGRINYAYKSKYLFEANIRTDGSSKFADGQRWGTFPSASFGWRVTEESFMGDSFRNFFQNFKLRGSLGKLGNNGVDGNYRYMNSYTNNEIYYSFNDNAAVSLWAKQLGNRLLKWEETKVFDLGLDIAFLNNRMSVELDYYNRKTDGILFKPSLAGVMGKKDAPYMNLAQVSNEGVELTVGWNDRIKDFEYGIKANVSYNHNKVDKYMGQLVENWITDANGNQVWSSNYGAVADGVDEAVVQGHTIKEFRNLLVYNGSGSYYNNDNTVNPNGGPKDGMIRTEADLEWVKAMQAAGYSFKPNNKVAQEALYYGDLIYADVNGDKVYGDPTTDKAFMGASTEPKWIVGINLNAAYKGFDFSMLWQGSFKAKAYGRENGMNTNAILSGLQIGKDVAENHYFYDPNNPDDPRTNISAKYPRLKFESDAINSVRSDYWIHSVSYMRLKNVQIGYTLPTNLSNKIGIGRARVYISGENLLTITPFDGIDPEAQLFSKYPPLKQFSFGVNVSF